MVILSQAKDCLNGLRKVQRLSDFGVHYKRSGSAGNPNE